MVGGVEGVALEYTGIEFVKLEPFRIRLNLRVVTPSETAYTPGSEQEGGA